MDQKQKRQKRFVQNARIKGRVKNLLHFSYSSKSDRTLGVLYHTRALCSCYMCGNPRKYDKEITLQEKSSLEFFRIELLEI